MRKLLLGVSSIALTCVAGHAMAQTAEQTNNEIIVTGTRTTGVKAADSAAPIQVVGQAALLKTGAVDLPAQLEADVPALNINTTGADMAALNIQAALRGLSPNDTLVLVNGKRIHTTANLAVDGGSPYSGAATVDLSWIPVGSIDHVEVLTDGAAAQYGTDAIAGVVNIILKKNSSGGTLDVTGGQFQSGTGATGAFYVNNGFSLGDKGFFNVTLDTKFHNYTTAGIGDERFQTKNGKQLPTCAGGATESSAFPPACLQFPDSGVGSSQKFPYENRVNGDPTYAIVNLMYNAGYELTPNLDLYSFGSIGYRQASHFENYRNPGRVEGCTATAGAGGTLIPGVVNGSGSGCTTGTFVLPFPDGFDPQEQIREYNGTFTAGLKGNIDVWDFDVATTFGEDYVPVYVNGSANNVLFSSLQSLSTSPLTPQTNFYDGGYETTQWTTTVDINRNFDVGLASPLNIAFGAEVREESYTLFAGEPSSYVDGGVQSFFGYSPLDASYHQRNVEAGYVDASVNPIKPLHLDAAVRYENYSDFGGALVGKLTGRYDFNPAFALRGTISNGFRAPTLAEEYYSGTNVGPTFAEAQLPPNSSAALASGFEPLKPETSDNYSIGFVAHPMPHMQITADIYDIELRDRIEVTNAFYGEFAGAVVDQNIINTIAARGVAIQPSLRSIAIATFTNAGNTNTSGLDLTANYASDFEQYGHVDWTVGFNFNHTYFTKIGSLPAAATCTAVQCVGLGQTPGSALITPQGVSDLITAVPEEKLILQALWTKGPWSVNLRESIYGKTSEKYDAPGLNGGDGGLFTESVPVTGITDIDVSYKVTQNIKVSAGANNLFNTVPPTAPVFGGQPADGGLVFNVPYAFSPYGINGGYYYGRVTVTW